MKKHVKLLIANSAIAIFLTTSFSGTAFAAADINLGKRVVRALHATDHFDSFLPMAATQIKVDLSNKNPKYADKIAKIVDEQALAVVGRRAELENEAAKIYANHFTTKELQAIADFYEGEVGKKLIQDGPKTIADLINAYNKWSASVGKELQQKSEEALKKSLGSSTK